MNCIAWIALPIGVLILGLKLYAIFKFQRTGRARVLESLESGGKHMHDLVNDQSIPYITRQMLWLHLESMQLARLIRYDFEPPHAPDEQPVKIYHLCTHGTHLLEEERAKPLLRAERTKRRKRVPGPT